MRYEESGAICSHSEEIEELESKLTAAQAEIARLREVLEKYANKNNWHYSSTNTVCSTGNKAHCHSVFLHEGDMEEQDLSVKEIDIFGGELARKALNKGEL